MGIAKEAQMSKHADEIKYAAKTLQKAYNETDGNPETIVKIKISEKELQRSYQCRKLLNLMIRK